MENILDFGFWILDFGLRKNPKSKIQNLKSSVRANLADPGPQLLGHGKAAEQRGGLLELDDHRVHGFVAVATHDSVQRVKKVFLDRLMRRVADVLFGYRPNASGEVDQLSVLLVGISLRLFF